MSADVVPITTTTDTVAAAATPPAAVNAILATRFDHMIEASDPAEPRQGSSGHPAFRTGSSA
ncbi:MAG: hypothetical protein ABMA25_24115, partial [Ilumatobacteraceae bacterium]